MPLTDLQIRNAKPKAAAYKLFDSEGLYLLGKPSSELAPRMVYFLWLFEL